jgi:hypothetical protein
MGHFAPNYYKLLQTITNYYKLLQTITKIIDETKKIRKRKINFILNIYKYQ